MSMMPRFPGTIARAAAVISLLGLSSGCSNSKELLLVQRTSIGFDAAVTGTTGTPSGKISLGWDRDFATSVPMTPVEGDASNESMSIVSCLDVTTSDRTNFAIDERLATGAAAKKYAESAAEAGSFFTCFSTATRAGASTVPGQN